MADSASRKLGRVRRRALSVLTNALNALFVPLLSPLVSLLVIRLASVELWGEFVNGLLIVQFASHILIWGNKDYLLREFSQQPANLRALWQINLLTRLVLFLGCVPLVLLLGWSWWRSTLIIIWVLATLICQAHDVLVLYRKAFGGQLLVELGSLSLVLAGVLWRGQQLTLDELIGGFALSALLKAGVLLLWLRPLTTRRAALRIDPGYFRAALPFFLLGLSGMVQSRIDQYYVNAVLTRREVAQYQILVNFLIYLQALASIGLAPFIKGLYRLPTAAILRLARTLLIGGLALIGPALGMLALVLARLYQISLPLNSWLVAGLIVLPIYAYLPVIYALYKAQRQSAVLRINLLGIAINLLLNVALVVRWRINGALIASAVAQWAMLIAYQRQARILRGHA